MPTPLQEPLGMHHKDSLNLLQDSKMLKYIKLDFLQEGSPEINFVLGPSAMDFQAQKEISLANSKFATHTSVAADEKISIKHIQQGGPTIQVTKKRVNRILKRRKKRVEFLIANPEFSFPYKFRTKGPKHQSRSKSAKNRSRKGDGRFAKVNSQVVDFTISMDDIDLSRDSKGDGHYDNIRNKL